MRKIFTFFVALIATCALWAGNVITYTASEKLPHAWNESGSGLHIPAFDVSITEHEFSNGKGTIHFASDVTTIGDYAFGRCYTLTSINIPSSVTSIGTHAFSGCRSLTTITIPDNVSNIEEYTFEGCYALTSISIPNSVNSIGAYAFSNCTSLATIAIPESVNSIEEWAFSSCDALASINIPSKVTSIERYTFYSCYNLISVTIPISVTSIGDFAFCNCSKLTTITIPLEVSSIGIYAFSDCYSLPIIDNIRYADTYLVEAVDKTLPTYHIKEGTRLIGSFAFSNCTALTSITIPESVLNIGQDVFCYCTSLMSILVEAGNIAYDSRENCNAIVETSSNTLIAGCINTIIPQSVTCIGNNAFCGCSNLTSITIPEGVTSIGSEAFNGCYSLTSITIPDGVTNIGDEAFRNCRSLNSITLPSSVITIGNNVFRECSGISTITILGNLQNIGEGAFYNCSSVHTITCWATIPPTCETSCFSGLKPLVLLNVPSQSIMLYNTANEWKRFTRVEPILETILFTITVTSSNDDMGIVSGSGTFHWRDTVSISATAATGFQFDGWSDGNTDNPRTIVVRGNMDLTANFSTKMCNLTIIPNIEEAADITGAGVYEYGTSITCYADVMTDYSFVKWSNGKTVNPYKFKIYDDMTLYVFFQANDAPVAPTEVVVTPTDSTAGIQWPQVDNATSYTMTITKGGETICTLTFNGLGQLINIDFSAAPARAAASAKVASATTGFNFTVTGLDSGTTYGYLIEAKNEKGEVISTEEGTFTTTGEGTAIEETTVNKYVNTATKLLRDGQMLILREGKTYNMQGAVVE